MLITDTLKLYHTTARLWTLLYAMKMHLRPGAAVERTSRQLQANSRMKAAVVAILYFNNCNSEGNWVFESDFTDIDRVYFASFSLCCLLL